MTDNFSPYTTTPWVSILIAIAVSAQGLGFIALVGLFAPEHPWAATAVLCLIAALEGLATTHFLATRAMGELDRNLYRLAEWVTLLVAVRLTLWLATGSMPTWTALVSDLGDFSHLVFDLPFVLAGGVVTFIWIRAITLGAFFRELGVTDEEAKLFRTYHEQRELFPTGTPFEKNRGQLARQLLASWAWGGVMLVICSVLTTFDFPALQDGRVRFTEQSVKPLLWFAITIYLLAGLCLVSWARQLALRARWMLLGATPTPGMERHWKRSTIKLLGVIALVALFLPAGAVAPVYYVVGAVVSGVFQFANWLMLAVGKLIAALLGMVGGAPPGTMESLTQSSRARELPSTDSIALDQPQWAMPDLSWIWWICLAAVVAVSLSYFFTDRIRTWPGALRRLWHRLFRWLASAKSLPSSAATRTTSSAVTAKRSVSPKKSARRWRLTGRDSRNQVRAVYLRLMARLQNQGLVRSNGETAQEFQRRVQTRWPDSQTPMTTLTRYFEKARYSTAPVDASMVQRSKQLYRRLRRLLRR